MSVLPRARRPARPTILAFQPVSSIPQGVAPSFRTFGEAAVSPGPDVARGVRRHPHAWPASPADLIASPVS